MNKSWKSFASLLSTPSPKTPSNRNSQRATTISSSRAIAHIKRSLSPNNKNDRQSHLPLKAFQILPTDEESLIEDASDTEEPCVQNLSISPTAQTISIEDCSAPSLNPRDVTFCDKTSIDSDIEDVSDAQNSTLAEPLEAIETNSDNSDCEAINCKREKRLKLDFVNQKSPRCGRRITDDILVIVNATSRAATMQKSSTWRSVVGEKNPKRFLRTSSKREGTWKRLDESFKDSHTITTPTSPPNLKWKTLDESFRKSPTAEIESNLTPESTTQVRDADPSTNLVSENSFYDPNPNNQRTLRVKLRKDNPLFNFQKVMSEKLSIQTFWLYERENGLIPAKKTIKIQNIIKIFGKVAISYTEPDEDDTEIQIEHILYVDPSERQLKNLSKGSTIEVEYDLEPHRLGRRKLVHLGVCKIKAVD